MPETGVFYDFHRIRPKTWRTNPRHVVFTSGLLSRYCLKLLISTVVEPFGLPSGKDEAHPKRLSSAPRRCSPTLNALGMNQLKHGYERGGQNSEAKRSNGLEALSDRYREHDEEENAAELYCPVETPPTNDPVRRHQKAYADRDERQAVDYYLVPRTRLVEPQVCSHDARE